MHYSTLDITLIPPALIYVLGALLVPLLKGKLRSAYILMIPVTAMYILLNTPIGTHSTYHVMLNYKLVLGRVDNLSRIFGCIFIIASFAGILFSLKVKDTVQHVSALIYAGSAIGVTFSGDLFSFYIFWEFMAIASAFLILASKTDESQKAGFRYIMVHIFGGLSLLAGIILQIKATGTTEFSFIGLDTTASYFIFIGVAVNAAVFPLHGWLKDAYPEATPTGAVFLSTFTTKSAVYVMARMFHGVELLIWLGVAMAVIPIFYGIIENNIRRVLAYCIINQVGFMLIGIGIGTQLAINGAAAHAFCHILYKALLFMSAGSVIQMTGKTKCTELGGLYKSMPITCIFGLIGGASVAFPMFCGFVSKSMTIAAASHEKMTFVWLALEFASVGAFLLAGIKVNFFTFFSKDSGLRPKEAPVNMLLAMGLIAFLCIYVGLKFDILYKYLPYPTDFMPYSAGHVSGQLQLLFFAGLAFCLMLFTGVYPKEMNGENLDTDWFYRKGASIFYFMSDFYLNSLNKISDFIFVSWIAGSINKFAVNAPVKLTLAVILPFKIIAGSKNEERIRFKEKLVSAYETGSLPVGIGAMLSIILIIIFFKSLF